jgi:hypothetical protein
MVANAQYQLAVEGLVLTNGIATSGGQIWYSNNYGVTWTSGGATQSPFTGVTSSSNGQFSYAVTIAGALFVNALGSPSTVPSVSQSQTVNGPLSVTGSSSLSNTLAVAGATTLNSTLSVAGASTLNSTLAVTGASTLNSTLSVTGASTLNSTLSVTGASTLNSTLAVAGASTFNGGVTIGTPYTLNILPAGMIMAWVSATAPTGWLICNGSSYSTTGTYANLFAVIQYTFGGSGSSFNVPNYQGAFLRGTGTSSVNTGYSGPSLNTSQNHATQTHNHSITDPGHTHTFTGGSITMYGESGLDNDKPASGSGNPENVTFKATGTNSSSTTSITVNNSTLNVDANETRPFNYGINWVIKY